MKILMKFGDFKEGSMYFKIFLLTLWCQRLVEFAAASTPLEPGMYTFWARIDMADDNQRVCGATLLNAVRSLTACHCVAKEAWPYGPPPAIFLWPPNLIVISAGHLGGTETKVSSRGKAIRVHPKCQVNETGFFYDYAVVEVKSPFPMTPKVIEWLNFPGIENSNTTAITQVIEEPEKHECISLDFDIVSFKDGALQLGRMTKVDITLNDSKHCEDFWNKHKRMYDPNLQVCAYRRGKDKPLQCPNPDSCPIDPGSMLMCSSEQKIEEKKMLPIGITTGRDQPYVGANVPEVYSRMDFGWEFLIEPIVPGDGVIFDDGI